MIVYSWRRAAPSSAAGVCHQSVRAWAARHATTIHNRTLTTSKVLAKAHSEALQILFCGSDLFSCASLKALHVEHERNKALVERLEVMVLPGKRMGRGFKKFSQVPCKELAQELGLTIHERETFRDWTLPQGTNLVVAVSFGLFVPPRILSSAKYGGLNVHPSLLPHLRGPAPIHHAYLRGDQYTGVTLQTLDPVAFDHGTVLAQTPAPGVALPAEQRFSELKRGLAAHGAAMLVRALRDGVHVPPHEEAGGSWAPPSSSSQALVHAPKTTKADSEVDWTTWRVDGVLRRLNVFGNVWTRSVVHAGKDTGKVRRVLWTKARAVAAEAVAASVDGLERRVIRVVMSGGGGHVERDVAVRVDRISGVCYFEDGDGGWIGVERAKLEGGSEKVAVASMKMLFRSHP